MNISTIKSEECIAKPIFMGEVNLYLKERFKNLNITGDTKVNNDLIQKVIDYSFKFLKTIEKEKIAKLRKYIDLETGQTCVKNENKFQAEFILCKMVDLKPQSLNIALKLFPEYIKYFNRTSFRKHFFSLLNLMN
jgi:hypothetical protein